MNDLQFSNSDAIEASTRAEIDIQIATAKKYPRSLQRCSQTALEMATFDEETAESCFYTLKRKNADGTTKKIEGPSIRLAEIMVTAWGNMRAAARITEISEMFVTAQAVVHDLENNVAYSVETRRRITDKKGRRYGDDMIVLTCNAAAAIAMRNAATKAIPGAYVKKVYESARTAAVGTVRTLEHRRQVALETFKKMGVDEEKVFGFLEVNGVEEIGLEQLKDLTGLKTAIKDGTTTIEQAFSTGVKVTPESPLPRKKRKGRKESPPEATKPSEADAPPPDYRNDLPKGDEPHPGVDETSATDEPPMTDTDVRRQFGQLIRTVGPGPSIRYFESQGTTLEAVESDLGQMRDIVAEKADFRANVIEFEEQMAK